MWKSVVRKVLLSALLAVWGGVAAAQGVSDPYAALEGKWFWVGHSNDPGAAKACADRWTELKFSADRKTLNARNPVANSQIKTYSYNVLYRENNSIAMYLNGEDRRVASGDHIIWIAIVESHSRFLWRLHGQATDAAELAKYARVRCPG